MVTHPCYTVTRGTVFRNISPRWVGLQVLDELNEMKCSVLLRKISSHMNDVHDFPLVLLWGYRVSCLWWITWCFYSAMVGLKCAFKFPRGASSCEVISVQHLPKTHRISASLFWDPTRAINCLIRIVELQLYHWIPKGWGRLGKEKDK